MGVFKSDFQVFLKPIRINIWLKILESNSFSKLRFHNSSNKKVLPLLRLARLRDSPSGSSLFGCIHYISLANFVNYTLTNLYSDQHRYGLQFLSSFPIFLNIDCLCKKIERYQMIPLLQNQYGFLIYRYHINYLRICQFYMKCICCAKTAKFVQMNFLLCKKREICTGDFYYKSEKLFF